MNCELLFTKFVLGFFLFNPSLLANEAKSALSSPKTGVLPDGVLEGYVGVVRSLFVSLELLDSFSFSWILYVARFDLVLVDVPVLYSCGDGFRGLNIHIDS